MPNAALFARISDILARTNAEVFTRTTENPSGTRLLCTIKTGGEQGNPLTPLQYACCISPALKNLEQRFPGVLVRAIHDDTTLLGDKETIFSEGGARQQLATDLANVGSELHEGKAEAYGMTQRQGSDPGGYQAAFRNLDGPSDGVQQVGFGIVDCGTPLGDDHFILASLEESAVTICNDIHHLVAGISEHSTHATFSMTYYSCMHRVDFLAGAIPPRLTKYFCTKIDEKLRWAFASALGSDLLADPTDANPDAAVTVDRAQLPARLGG
jgi:hypothetical protein